MKVTPEVVKEAVNNLRDSKPDPVYNFIIEINKNQLGLAEFTVEELNDILRYLCTG